MARIRSRGRKKLAMKKIAVKSNLDVTFSKRRSGLFKKACELCTLCMCEIAIIIFSPQQRPYSLGHPTVESVLNRFLNGNPPQENSRIEQLVASLQDDNIASLNTKLADLNNAIDVEKKRAKSLGEKMAEKMKAHRNEYWWLRPIDELSIEEAQQMLLAIEEMQKNVRIGQLQRSINSTPGAVSLLQYSNTPFFGARSSGPTDDIPSIHLVSGSEPTDGMPSVDLASGSEPTDGLPSADLSRASGGVSFAPPPPPPQFNSGFAAFADPGRASGGVRFAPPPPPPQFNSGFAAFADPGRASGGVRFAPPPFPPPPPQFNSGFSPSADPSWAIGGFSGGGFRFSAPIPHFEFMNRGSSSGSGGGGDGDGVSGSGSRGYVGARDKGKAPMMDRQDED